MPNPIPMSWLCDTMKEVRQADDLFVCLSAKPNKGLTLRSSTRTEVSKGTPVRRVGKRNSEKVVGEGWRRRAIDNGQQKEAVRESQSGWVEIPSSFVEISLEIHASISLQMHRECSVTNHPSCTLSWPKSLLFVCFLFFFSHSLSCISFGHKEMYDAPIGTTRWITGQDRICSKKLMYRGAEGVLSQLYILCV